MEKYILGKISSSGGATVYKNPSDQTVTVGKSSNMAKNEEKPCSVFV